MRADRGVYGRHCLGRGIRETLTEKGVREHSQVEAGGVAPREVLGAEEAVKAQDLSRTRLVC